MELSAKLRTGVVSLDDQKRQLFAGLQTLEAAVSEQRTLFAVYTLTRLTHQFRNYFNAEEQLMKNHAYPALDEHVAEHCEFRLHLQELARKSVSQDVSTETLTFLKEWLSNHIKLHDMKYVPYIKQ